MRQRLLVISVSALTAFTYSSTMTFAMGNPASAFCEEMGGRSEDAKVKSGDTIGLCVLPGKKIVEEWTLFRMFDGKVPARKDNPFRL